MFKKAKYAIITMFSVLILFSTNVKADFQGIDVSEWQGYINYENVKRDGIEIVYIKASQGSNITDPYFKTNYNNAKANGLKVGLYHFLTARTVEEAREEAEHFSSVISGTSPDCKLAMDFEELGDLSRKEINDISLAFLERVEELTKKELIIYSDESNAVNTFSRELAQRYPLWIAEYGVSRPSRTGNWSDWTGFQYSDTGRISGINGYVDRDLFKDEILLSSDSNQSIKTKENTKDTIITYTVRRGDTLSEIARRYGTTVTQIAGLNGIRDRDLIYVGERLRIDVTRSLDEVQKTVHETGHRIYTVKRGDTLSEIAREFDTTVNSITRLNDINNVNLIFAGERLRIAK